jgi:hypothetical protein
VHPRQRKTAEFVLALMIRADFRNDREEHDNSKIIHVGGKFQRPAWRDGNSGTNRVGGDKKIKKKKFPPRKVIRNIVVGCLMACESRSFRAGSVRFNSGQISRLCSSKLIKMAEAGNGGWVLSHRMVL